MVKTRFSSLDVRAMVNSIRPEAVGCKLSNIYDINSKVYILKLARKGFKRFLLLESGMRFHITDYQRDKSSMPSNFTMKLRKHIRTRRLTSIQQLGTDRAVDFTFGRGDTCFHLILEIYVSGNLILTDHEYRILALLRTHGEVESSSRVAVKHLYPLENATGLLTATMVDLEDAIENILDKASDRQQKQEDLEIDQEDEKAAQAKKAGESVFARKKSKKRVEHVALPLHTILHKLMPWSDPQLCAHCLARVMTEEERPFVNAFKLNIDDLEMDDMVTVLKRSTELALDTLRSVSRPDDLGGGHMPVLAEVSEAIDADADDADGSDDEEDEEGAAVDKAKAEQPEEVNRAPQEAEAPIIPGWIIRKHLHVPPAEPRWANDEFTPLQPQMNVDPDSIVCYPKFHLCVDEFYTKLEEHRAQESKAQHAQNVYAKVDKIRIDQERRIAQLEAEQDASEMQASLIEANVELVERALMMVNTMIASQVDWGELWREVKRQQRLGHPIAQHIQSLDFERNEFKMLLGAQADDDDFDLAEDTPMQVVSLDLSLSAHANVARVHSFRKETRQKASRTVMHTEVVVKQAERKAQQDLKKFELKQTLRRVRQSWWFEKFLWFISSENYLVISGRDAIQTESIFCKHFGPQDIFVQADVQGARSCFIKNHAGGEVPPATLREAGTMALCHSSAWDKHMVISAWWVYSNQVVRAGKGAPVDSDCVLVDGFTVRGRRHFMPPLHTEMGFTLLFHVADGSAEKHRGERRSRYFEAMGKSIGEGNRQDSDDDKDEDPEIAVEIEPESDVDVPHQDITAPAEDLPDACEQEHASVERETDRQGATHDEQDTNESFNERFGISSAAEDQVAGEDAKQEEIQDDERDARGRVSKAERRRMKKGAADEVPSKQPAVQAKAGPKPAAKAPVVLPRGQKAKAKKMKEKYGEQDDEERELRLSLLGSKASKVLSIATESAVGKDRSPSVEEEIENAPAPSAPPSSALSPKVVEKNSQGKSGNVKGAGKGDKRSQVNTTNEILRPGCDLDEGADLQLAQLDLLTGQPSLEDEVLYAMPMVAPYCALGGPYSLRVKLTPGPTKKGQASKTCLRMLEAQLEKATWKPLVQAIPENEAAALMCGTCKLSMPGMQKLHAQVKKEQKKEKQEKSSKK